jgi:WD40-like Beta Propeller Repeat
VWGRENLADEHFLRRLKRLARNGKRFQDQRKFTLGSFGAGTTDLHRLFTGWHNPPAGCCGKWTADGKYFVFRSQRQIWALTERREFLRQSTVKPIQLTSSPLSLFMPLPSKDGKKLFVVGKTSAVNCNASNPSPVGSSPFFLASLLKMRRFPKTASGWPTSPTPKASSGEAGRTVARRNSSATPLCSRCCLACGPTVNRLHSMTTQSEDQ